jgi:hypothetical protein
MKRWYAIVIVLALLATTMLVQAQSSPLAAVQVVRQQATLIDAEGLPIGTAEYWNTRNNFHVQLNLADGWNITSTQVYAGLESPPLKNDKPVPGQFPCKREFSDNPQNIMLMCSLQDELAFSWGWGRTRYTAFHGDLVQLDDMGAVVAINEFWGLPVDELGALESYTPWPGLNWGGYFMTTFYHPDRGHFIDSPVAGLSYQTPTNWGTTDVGGGFDYFPGERVDLWVGSVYLGSPLADHKISPLDVFESYDLDDNAVINMARLLQSLDADGAPKGGINITPSVTACLDAAAADLYSEDEIVNFYDDAEVEALINQTLARCDGTPDVTLVKVSAEDAKAHLAGTLDSSMFRKNVAKTPEMSSSKSKLNLMARWFPALRANNELVEIEYYDEDGALIRTATEAKPIVVAYTDAVPETGAEDIFAAISRDDGNTFKRMNVARAADKSSFTLANGLDYYGEAKKPVMGVQDNNILIAWTSKYCNGGRPAYAIDIDSETDDYIYDNEYYTEDIWGVAGPQRSHDYTDEGFPEVGEVPYSCVWVARGTIVTQEMIDSGGFWANQTLGQIQWFKPERLTSGRRDANQVFLGSADGAGFAIAWQEDPDGLRPGQAKGPGPGWGGATTNHKTDIWYSYIHMDDFLLVDGNFVSGGEPLHEDPDVIGRPKALVPMSLPVRVTDNDVVNSENIMATTTNFVDWIPTFKDVEGEGDGDGTHAYGYMIDGLCTAWYEKVNEQGELKEVCVTADGRLLDGDTGASRPNLFLQKYTKADGTVSAWAIFAYDESKGLGAGPPDEPGIPSEGGGEYLPEEGKNSFYHSFDFQTPDLVSAGTLINLPEKDITVNEDFTYTINGNISYVVDENGAQILDWQDQPQINYENARRPRFIIQGKKAATDAASNTIMLILYKEGEQGSGRPSDIMLRRVVVPEGQIGNPYHPENIVCNLWETALNGQTVCVDGAQNMSTVLPTATTDSQGDPTSEDPYGAVKVVQWEQTVDTLSWPSGVNRYEDARAHRGAIMGDFIVMGYSYTPNWAAYRNGNDKYDFFIRRSFDGGLTWTTDPNGAGVTNCDTFTDPVSKEKTEVCTFYAAGAFEQARNLSQLPNSKSSVIEPRIVKAPGTITNPDGAATGYPEDINTFGMYYVSYGTASNPGQIVGHPEEPVEIEEAAPMDLFYSFSLDLGETHVEVAWDVNPDSEGNFAGETVTRWDFLAKGDPEQGEAQLRMTPDGSRFYAVWVQDGEEGSDIWFRRIMSPEFDSNVATP